MKDAFVRLKNDLQILTDELYEAEFFTPEKVLVIGCSTSETIGKRIGKSSSDEAAEVIYSHFSKIADEENMHLLFQGCEHINRSLTTSRHTMEALKLEEVTVVPHKEAGGSLSELAYKEIADSVVVEAVTADRGIDIGQTLIGMHLKHVAIPVRTSVKKVGEAVVTIATTRPKLVGGPRAHYK
ncbi:MAG: TIGR01440 family protein [Jeotgalicoccus sp.]|nr:TIGR01440 family protein [Jeotgalicoccus sp.]